MPTVDTSQNQNDQPSASTRNGLPSPLTLGVIVGSFLAVSLVVYLVITMPLIGIAAGLVYTVLELSFLSAKTRPAAEIARRFAWGMVFVAGIGGALVLLLRFLPLP